MKISVVTAYFNRKKLFYNTLLKLQKSAIKDFEVIAVDDGSSDDNRLEGLQNEFDFLKIIRIEPRDKWYTNACIPFNIGFKEAKGEIIILQNPECLHYGDVLKYVTDNLKQNDYISFSCFSLDRATTDALNKSTIDAIDTETKINFLQKKIEFDGDAGWYNHSLINPRGFHWCAALYKSDLGALKGFDERFALGIACDDCEFLFRVKKKGMNFKIIDHPFVLHQNHYFFDQEAKQILNPAYQKPDGNFLWRKNQYLFDKTVNKGNWKIKRLSKNAITISDFFLTKKLKSTEYLNSLALRIKARLNILKQKRPIS